MAKYKRTLSDLKENAVLHWPQSIIEAAATISVLPLLLKTQDAFVALLKVADRNPLSWNTVLKNGATLSGPLFLKHLMVLSDMGGEALNKLPPVTKYFPKGEMIFVWNDKEYSYLFQEIGQDCSLVNSVLKVDSKGLLTNQPFSNRMLDVAMLLLYGGLSINDTLPIEVREKCIIGDLIGKPEELDKFVKENYLRVSKQVSGAQSNALGQYAQDFVVTKLTEKLPNSWAVERNGTLTGVAHSSEGSGTTFDVVVTSPDNKEFGIEVSFQVTTNSVIERKARESAALMKSVHRAGHKICYVIDGAGNINVREHAVGIICDNSDCTVAMSEDELDYLVSFMVEQ